MDAKVKERLKEAYVRRGLVLALGAGVSQGSGLPDWQGLIKRLGDNLRETEQGEPPIFETLKDAGYSLPAIASVIEAAYDRHGLDFARAVQEQLYKDFRKEVGEADYKSKGPEFVKHFSANTTLRSVAALCAVRRELKGAAYYARNPRLHAVVTTNVDSILRSYIHARYPPLLPWDANLVRSIERPSTQGSYDTIPIYYLHGFIRFDKDVREVHKHAADLRVFTEQEFFDFFNNPHGMFNYTFLFLLREHPCVFLGMSLRDDNIRRLLHYSRKERFESKKHELLGLAEGKQNEKLRRRLGRLPENEGERKRLLAELAEDDSLRHFLVDRHPLTEDGRKNGRLAELIEVSLRRLGVNVLWVDEFSEIRDLFRELYESPDDGRYSWDEVYEVRGS